MYHEKPQVKSLREISYIWHIYWWEYSSVQSCVGCWLTFCLSSGEHGAERLNYNFFVKISSQFLNVKNSMISNKIIICQIYVCRFQFLEKNCNFEHQFFFSELTVLAFLNIITWAKYIWRIFPDQDFNNSRFLVISSFKGKSNYILFRNL